MTLSISNNRHNHFLQSCLVSKIRVERYTYIKTSKFILLSARTKLILAPSVANTVLVIERLLAWLGQADGADVGHFLEGRAHEQEGEVVVVVVNVQVRVFLKNQEGYNINS